MRIICLILLLLTAGAFSDIPSPNSNDKPQGNYPLLQGWIRINQLGYTTKGVKVAVWCSKAATTISEWKLVDINTKKVVATGKAGNAFGKYGPFLQSYRLDFSRFRTPGKYTLEAGGITSPAFVIGDDVYKGAADFCLRYMRQQRTGFNPYLKDSCHTNDGYTLYGSAAGLPDSTYIDVVGGWHDASDYLQYSTTSANATYHLLMAYRDFPGIFEDEKLSNGLDGSNGRADVLDEARWGLDWLLKMHPEKDWLFNQIADDRDHMGMRIPKEDSFYGRGHQRPVYFVSGEPQQRGKFMNNTTGTSSTAAKFSSAFSLGYQLFQQYDKNYAKELWTKAGTALVYADKKRGVTQTASVRSPYIYAEDNWQDDMELGRAAYAAAANEMNRDAGDMIAKGFDHAEQEKITPWLGTDTAKHYQWYPFINLGHREMSVLLGKESVRAKDPAKYDEMRSKLISWYREGIEKVWQKAKGNAFYRGVPFIWCSNNLTVSFAMQCYWYRELTGDKKYEALEQANFDWLFGCNPWGTSMVYGLPNWGDTPVDPHSAFTHIKNYPIDGGLVDGPVYGSIYKGLIGIQLKDPDEYEAFQSDVAVYHDDYGDYSTNEPTMDGTASLIYLLAAKEAEATTPAQKMKAVKKNSKIFSWHQGAIIRGDSARKEIALVFTGDEFADGGTYINSVLADEKIRASFFLTGRFYREKQFSPVITQLKKNGHYLGAHSDQHLLYNDWSKRDSLLVSKELFITDLLKNYSEMKKAGIDQTKATFFLPPYEWYNDSIAAWTKELGLQLINFTPGTRSTADYTWPGEKNYRSSEEIYQSVINREKASEKGLNGFILLIHIGTDPRRTDKFYRKLPALIRLLKGKGYQFQTVDNLLRID